MNISVIAWLVVGIVAGLAGRWLVPQTGFGVATDLVVAVIGAFLGGCAFVAFATAGFDGFDPGSILPAVAGAVFALVVHYALFGRRGRS